MNKSYKVIFNRMRGTSAVVSEISSSKQSRKKAMVTVAVAMALGMMVEGTPAYGKNLVITGVSNGNVVGYILDAYDNNVIMGGAKGGSTDDYGLEDTPSNSFSMGKESIATGSNCVAMGYGAQAHGNATVAMGYKSVARGDASVAIGKSTANGPDCVAMGSSTASGITSIALGTATASENRSVAMGYQATATATDAVALGAGSNATGTFSFAANGGTAYGTNDIAIGSVAKAGISGVNDNYAVAIGANAHATHSNSVALGYGSVTSDAYEVSVGFYTSDTDKLYRKITNVASAGTLTSDNSNAATGADVYNAVYNATTIVGNTAHNYYTGTTTNPTSVITAINALDTAIGEKITSDGTYIKSSTTNSVNANIQALDEALTTMNTTVTAVSTKANNSVQYDPEDSITFSKPSNAAIELKNVANGTLDNSAATVGQVKSYTSIKVGAQTVTSSANGIEFVAGENIQIDTSNNKLTISSLGGADTLAVHYAENSSNKLSLTDSGSSVLIENVAAGEVSETSTDAINGSQLYAVDAKIGADIASDGTYIKKSATNSVNANIQALDTALGNALKGDTSQNLAIGGATLGSDALQSVAIGSETAVTGTQSIAIGYKNTVTGSHSGAFGDPNVVTGNGSYAFGNNNTIAGDNVFVLGNDVDASSTNVSNAVVLGNQSKAVSNAVSVGSDTQQRQIKYVATPTDATDAANKYYVDSSVNYLDNRLTKKINRLGAKSAAISALHPMGLDEDHKFSASVGAGTYGGQAAAAVGVFYKPNENWMFNVGGAAGRGSVMGNIGVNYRFGAPSSVKTLSTSQVAAQVVALQDTNRSIEAQLKASLSREEASEKRHQTEMAYLQKTSNARIAKLEKQNARLMKDFAKMKVMMRQLAAQQKK